MKKQKFSLILVAMLMMVQGIAQGQVKIYTKKARMDDFNSKTTKVVAAGQSITAMTLQKELEGRWLCSPYEICIESEYEELKSSNEYYFLYLSKENGIIFINLDKGGKKDDPDNKAKPFDVVRIPVCCCRTCRRFCRCALRGLCSGRSAEFRRRRDDFRQGGLQRAQVIQQQESRRTQGGD